MEIGPAGEPLPAGQSLPQRNFVRREEVLILGASVRAAAHSALRAGLRPVGGDLFADRDLCAVCPAYTVPRAHFPGGLEALAIQLPRGPWLYTGALENHPDLIARIAHSRPLWGNEGSVVRAVRDPLKVAETLRAAELPHPAVRINPRGLPRDASWLIKPLASAGGRHIVPLTTGRAHLDRPCYYQERIDGTSLSALVLGEKTGGKLLGVTWQWVGLPDDPFAYRGSIGPWPLTQCQRDRIERLGRALTSAFGLVGLFGIDLILRDGQPWPVEVNPRYTASVEVLEMSLGRAFLADHRRACDPNAAPHEPALRDPLPGVVGKVIVFAVKACTFPDGETGQPSPIDWFQVPRIADVPHPGTHFERGDPVLTLFAQAPDVPSCKARLQKLQAQYERRLKCNGAQLVE